MATINSVALSHVPQQPSATLPAVKQQAASTPQVISSPAKQEMPLQFEQGGAQNQNSSIPKMPLAPEMQMETVGFVSGVAVKVHIDERGNPIDLHPSRDFVRRYQEQLQQTEQTKGSSLLPDQDSGVSEA
jgi:hypothetical protein